MLFSPAVWMLRLLLVLLAIAVSACSSIPIANFSPHSEIYQTRSLHSPDGIGKFYMGREIAQVMGHQGAAWLERSSRAIEE
ncbi:MAG TPA: hypothetical protein V6C65_13170, partial [Allocoleopsis sp.]